MKTRLTQIALLIFAVAGCAPAADCDEPVSIEQVKKSISAAIERTGHRVGDVTNSVIDRDAPAIAKTTNEMADVKIFVNKKNGLEDGLCYATYPNGEIQRVGYYAGGNRIGDWRFYHTDGTVLAKAQYNNNGEKVGQHLAYHRNGNLRYSESYLAGVNHGPKLTYHENGILQMHQDWRNGKIHGISMIYYPNGLLKKLGTWTNSKQHGVIAFYDDDGTFREQQTYVDGVRTE